MKRALGALMLLAAVAAFADTVHMKDGSSLEGDVLLLNETSLMLSTSFAGTLTLARDRIAAVVFDKAFLSAGVTPPQKAAPDLGAPLGGPGAGPVAADMSTLEVSIEGDPAKSSVRFVKESERELMTGLNARHLRVFMDGMEVAHATDPEMDKEFRQGRWTVLRNSHRFEPLRVELPAGRHRIQIVVGNDSGLAGGVGDQELVSAEVQVDAVDILPGQKTRVVLKGRSGRLGTYGQFEMELLSSR